MTSTLHRGSQLFRPERQAPRADDDPAWRAAWLVEVERLPHESERLLQRHPEVAPGLRALLAASAALQFDDPEAARRHADTALHHHPDALDPLHLWAQLLRGQALLEAAQPDEAPLRLALRGATRDALPLMQLDALRSLARLHDERGEAAARDQALSAGLALAAQHPGLAAADSLRRLAAQLALREGRVVALAGDRPPLRMHAALGQLLAGDEAAARSTVADLDAARALHFWPLKWQLDLGWLRGLLAAREGQPPRLPVLQGVSGRDATLCGLHAQVLDAGHALLRWQGPSADALAALAAGLQQAGLARASVRLALVQGLALADPMPALIAWEANPACDPLDALWLAPRVLPYWPALLAARSASRGSARQQWLRRLGALMQPARASASEAEGLTPREQEVLGLIGQQWSNAQIAARLGVAESTVKTHINRLYAKLDLPHRDAAVQLAAQASKK